MFRHRFPVSQFASGIALVLALGVAVAANDEVTRIEVTSDVGTEFALRCDAVPVGADAPLRFQGTGAQSFEFPPGRIECALEVTNGGGVRVEAIGARGNRSVLGTRGSGSRIIFAVE